MPVCSKTSCTFAASNHPDYNPTNHWSNSEVAKAYSKYVKNRKGQAVHSLTMNKRLVRDGNNKIIYPARKENHEVSKIVYSIHNIQKLNLSIDSCNNFSTSSSGENHTLPETLSIEEQLEKGNSSYEVKKNDKVHVVKYNNISEIKLDSTPEIDQVAITNNNNQSRGHLYS